jgi:hypothetical protein
MRKRAPYARSSVWYAVIALGILVVAALVVASIEIIHLRSQVHTLQQKSAQLSFIYLKLLAQGK